MTPLPHPLALAASGAIGPAALGDAPLPLPPDPEPLTPATPRVNAHRVPPPAPTHPRLRRAGRIALFAAAAARQAFDASPVPLVPERTGLILCYFTGPIHHSRRFFQGSLADGRRLASPALFPETVFNSPSSHVAAVLGLDRHVYSLVGDDTALAEGIRVAALWFALGQIDAALLIGAEELDPIALHAYQTARWLAPHQPPFRPAEGAGALLLLAPHATPNAPRLTALWGPRPYRSKRDARAAAAALAADLAEGPVFETAGAPPWTALQNAHFSDRLIPNPDAPPGVAFTASAAWNLIRAAAHLAACVNVGSLAVPVWGCNHQLAAVLLER